MPSAMVTQRMPLRARSTATLAALISTLRSPVTSGSALCGASYHPRAKGADVTDKIDNIIVEHLKAIRAELAEIKADTSDIKLRLHSVDTSVIELRRNDVHLFEDDARQQVSLDKLLERIQRIEKRLDLT